MDINVFSHSAEENRMSIKNMLAVGSIILSLTACSTTPDQSVNSTASESQIQELENKVGDRVFFEFDSSAITTEGQDTLRKQAQFMGENPDLKFTIEGYADERGTREYNLALGERRANSVKQFLLSVGIDASRVATVSYGKEKPAVLGSNDWAWSQNRRGVTKID